MQDHLASGVVVRIQSGDTDVLVEVRALVQRCLYGGANGLVTLTCLLVGDNALLLGLDICHEKYLLVIESD